MKKLGLAVLLAVGCGKKPAATKPVVSQPSSLPASRPASAAAPVGMPDADFKLVMGVVGKLGAIAQADQTDCDKMADEATKYVDTPVNRDAIARMTAMNNGPKPTPDQLQQLIAAVAQMAPYDVCAKTNAKVRALVKTFGGK